MCRTTITFAAILSLSLFAAIANGQRRDDANGQPVQSADQLPNNLPAQQPTAQSGTTQQVIGQSPSNPQQPGNQANSNQQTSSQGQMAQPANRRDYFLASWIGADNFTEIQVNQFALQHSSNQDVKNFAEEMIRVHTDLANKINQAVADENHSTADVNRRPYTAGYRGLPTSSNIAKNASPKAGKAGEENANAADQKTVAVGGQAVSQPNAQNDPPANGQTNGQQNSSATFQTTTGESGEWNGHMSAISVKREINKQLVRNIEQKLGEKKGEDFDRCFMAGQVAAHMHMLATLEVARGQVSPQLKSVLDEAANAAQKHLSHAESLVAQLEKK